MEYNQKTINGETFDNLTDTVFDRCNIENAKFKNLENVTFLKCNVKACDFTDTETYENVTLDRSNFINSVNFDATKVTNISSNIMDEPENAEVEEENSAE